jgi:uncharacterized membrane protein YbhN (UPF0104 family)
MTTCAHLESVELPDAPAQVAGCEECLASGTPWMHLRMCQTCGHVGCCDESPGRHATAHHRATGHPVIRSLEPGEDWSWCYVDETLLDRGDEEKLDGERPGQMPDEMDSRHLLRRLGELALLVGVVALLINTLPGLDDVKQRFASADVGWIAASGVIQLASCLAYVAAFRGVFCRGIGWRFSYEIGMAEQATNVLLPTGGAGGLALGAWALRQGGMPTQHIARRSVAFFLITSTPNFAVAAVLGPILALGLLPGRSQTAVSAVLGGIALLTIIAVLKLPSLLGRRRRRRPCAPAGEGWRMRVRSALLATGGATTAGIEDAAALVRSRDPLVVGGAIGYMAFDVLALVAAFEAFGGAPPVGPLLFAYTIGQLGGLIPLPGGIGGTDGGLIGAFVLYGTPLSEATAAVLAYRAFQLGIPALLGTAAFVQLRRRLARHPQPAALCFPLAEGSPGASQRTLVAEQA